MQEHSQIDPPLLLWYVSARHAPYDTSLGHHTLEPPFSFSGLTLSGLPVVRRHPLAFGE